MRIVLLTVIAAACRHAAVTAPITDTDDDDLPDDVDRCPDLPGDCGLVDDADGCPDPGPMIVHLPLGADDRARLAEVARARPALDLIVVGHALPNEAPGLALERAVAIALRLEELGVPLEHLLARATGPRAPDDTRVVEIRCTDPAQAGTGPARGPWSTPPAAKLAVLHAPEVAHGVLRARACSATPPSPPRPPSS